MGEEDFPSLWRGTLSGETRHLCGTGARHLQSSGSWGVCPVWAGTFGHSVTVTGAPKWLQGSTPEGGDGVQDGEHLWCPSSSSKK